MKIMQVLDQNGSDHKKTNEIEALHIKSATIKFLPNFKNKLPRLKAFAVQS